MKYDGLSIIVPVYNGEQYLEKCVYSILNQSYKQIEVVLVNDGSTDCSYDICKKIEKNDKRVTLLNQSNKGQNGARITGVMHAHYDLIGFVDCDDWIDEEMYSSLMALMKEYNCDIVSSGIIHEYETTKNSKEILDCYEEGLYDDLSRDIYPSMLWNRKTKEFGLYCNLVNKLFKKDILEQVYKELDARVFYGEDALAFYSYMMKCKNIYICKSSYYHYRIRNNSISASIDQRLVMNSYYLYKGLEKAIFDSFCNDKSKYNLLKQLKNYILQIEAHVLRQMYDINTNHLCIDDDSFDILKEKKVVIYGAGDIGQCICQYLRKNIKCEIVGWVDKYPNGKDRKCNYNISDLFDIDKMAYDYIIIAVKDKNMVDDIKSELVDKYGISEDLLLWKENYMESIFEDAYLI